MLPSDFASCEELHSSAHVESIELQLEDAEARRASLEGVGAIESPGSPRPDSTLTARMGAEVEAAMHPGWEVYRLSCPASGEVCYIAAASANAAYRRARRRRWPISRRGEINVQPVWGCYAVEARGADGSWSHLLTVRARSAFHAVVIAKTKHPGRDVRPASLWSTEAHVRIAA